MLQMTNHSRGINLAERAARASEIFSTPSVPGVERAVQTFRQRRADVEIAKERLADAFRHHQHEDADHPVIVEARAALARAENAARAAGVKRNEARDTSERAFEVAVAKHFDEAAPLLDEVADVLDALSQPIFELFAFATNRNLPRNRALNEVLKLREGVRALRIMANGRGE